MPYAAGYEGFSAASSRAHAHHLHAGPGLVVRSSVESSTCARARNHARVCGAAPATAHARPHASSRRSVEMLGVLLDQGMNVARLNFSHGDHAAHAGTIGAVETSSGQAPGVHCAIMLTRRAPRSRVSSTPPLGISWAHQREHVDPTTDYDHKSTGEKLAAPTKISR